MTFWILLVMAGFLTVLALWRYNFVFYFVASFGWWGLWAYHVNYPPANIVIGTLAYDIIYYTLILVALGVFLLYFIGRRQRQSMTSLGVEDGKIVANTASQESTADATEEYRQRVRRALNPRRRR